MKNISLFFVGLILLVFACTSKRINATHTVDLNDTLCYRNIFHSSSSGLTDTTEVRLLIKNDDVNGDYTVYSGGRTRSGKLNGTLKNDTLKVLWTYPLGNFKTNEDLKFYFDNKKLVQLGTYPSDTDEFEKVDCGKMRLGIRQGL